DGPRGCAAPGSAGGSEERVGELGRDAEGGAAEALDGLFVGLGGGERDAEGEGRGGGSPGLQRHGHAPDPGQTAAGGDGTAARRGARRRRSMVVSSAAGAGSATPRARGGSVGRQGSSGTATPQIPDRPRPGSTDQPRSRVSAIWVRICSAGGRSGASVRAMAS